MVTRPGGRYDSLAQHKESSLNAKLTVHMFPERDVFLGAAAGKCRRSSCRPETPHWPAENRHVLNLKRGAQTARRSIITALVSAARTASIRDINAGGGTFITPKQRLCL